MNADAQGGDCLAPAPPQRPNLAQQEWQTKAQKLAFFLSLYAGDPRFTAEREACFRSLEPNLRALTEQLAGTGRLLPPYVWLKTRAVCTRAANKQRTLWQQRAVGEKWL